MTRLARYIGAIVVAGALTLAGTACLPIHQAIRSTVEEPQPTNPPDLTGRPQVPYCFDEDNHSAPPLECPPGISPGSHIKPPS